MKSFFVLIACSIFLCDYLVYSQTGGGGGGGGGGGKYCKYEINYSI